MWRTQETQIPNGHRRLTLDFQSPAARAKKVPFLNEPPTSGLLWVTANKDRCLQNFLWALSIQCAGKSFLAYSDHLILTPLMEQRNYIVIHIRQSITLIWASQYINSTITCGSQSTVPLEQRDYQLLWLTHFPTHLEPGGQEGHGELLAPKQMQIRQHTRKAGRRYPRNQSQRIRHLSVQPAPIAPGPLQKTKSWGIPRGHACRPEETAFGNRNTSSKHASALYIREHNTANAQERACECDKQPRVSALQSKDDLCLNLYLYCEKELF